MKKILLIGLIVIAVPLYSYNVFLMLRVALPSGKSGQRSTGGENALSFESIVAAAAPVVFEDKGKDPFVLYREKPKPVVQRKPVAKKSVKKEVKPPAITVTGIMWNPDNPVAMIKLPGSRSKLVKSGQQISENLTVKKVGKKSVTVVYEGTAFTFERK